MSAAVKPWAAQDAEEWVQFVNYTQIAVGAVPGNAELHDMPPQRIRIHPMVIKDGRISVTRALGRHEWRPLAAATGIDPRAVELRSFRYRVAVATEKGRLSGEG